MAFDPSIISAIPGMSDSQAGIERGINIGDAINRSQLNKLQLNEAKRNQQEQGQVNEILKGSDYSTPEGLAATVSKVNKVSPKAAMGLMKEGQAYQSGKVQQDMDMLSLASQRQDLLVSAIDPIVSQAREMKNKGASELEVKAFITQNVPDAINNLKNMKMSDGKPAIPDDVLKMATNVPGGYTLATLESWEAKTKQGQQLVKQRLDQYKTDLSTRKQDEVERHNQAMERTGARRVDNSSGAGEFGGEVGQVLAAMSDIGTALPTGLRAKQQMLGTIKGLIEKHPNESADQIAERVRAGQLKMTSDKTGATVVARREASAAAAINALNRTGGLYDQALETGKKVDFSGNKIENAWELYKQGKVIENPDLSEYINTLADTRAEFASVLARGGQVTDSVRIAAEHAFPDKMSYSELSRNVERSKKIATSIQDGNEAVADALINGKSMAEVLKDSMKPKSPEAGASSGSTPRTPGEASASGALSPGSKYQHSSGATVEIID